MYRSIKEQIFSLPDTCLLYPGHDYRGLTVTTVEEEKRFNPRLGGHLSESDFAGFMANLGLAHPKQIDVAVPANLKCGRPADLTPPKDPDWAPLTLSFAGIWEIQPQGLEEHLREVQVVDVREISEFEGPLGHIRGARLIPLGELTQRAGELSRDRPIVTVCRAGGRSAQATVLLQKAGFANVANLAGGMLRWRAQHHPVEGAHE
jgi:rhodanese-related sulfurtransferase